MLGVVYAGKLHGKEVAVKKLLAAEIDQEALDSFKHEVDIMNKLRSAIHSVCSIGRLTSFSCMLAGIPISCYSWVRVSKRISS